jgi:uncharacterized membrane protein
MALATKHDLGLCLEHRPGDYLTGGTTLLTVLPAERWNPELDRKLNAAFICGVHGTPEQDIEYSIRQLVEVAVRALSPGINDPFTAVNCIDVLGASMCSIARRALPCPLRFDGGGVLRIVTPVSTFDGIADTAFNQIRQYGAASVAVTLRLLEIIAVCASQLCNDQHRQSLLRHAEMIYRQADDVITAERDRADIRQRWQVASEALIGSSSQRRMGGGNPVLGDAITNGIAT